MSFLDWFSSKPTKIASKVIHAVKKTAVKVENFAHKMEAKVAHLATDLAYKLAKDDAKYQEHQLKTMQILENNGWEVLCNSSQFANTNQYAYKAVAFVNKNTNEILIATAGTVPTEIYDLKDDIYIAAGSFPAKVEQAKDMIDNVTNLLGANANNYTFNVTGHSLGAVLTDVTAFEIMSRGLNLGTSITFDSPGSKNSINKAIRAEVFSNDAIVTIEDLAKHCVVYNSKHNIINYNPIKDCPHITEPKLVLPAKQATTDGAIQYTTEPSGILGYASYLLSKIGSNIVKTCSDYLGVTRTLNELDNLQGHSLKNFADLCEKPVVQTEGWDKTADGMLFIKYSCTLSNITSTGKDVISMTTDGDFDVIEAHSYGDLIRADSYKDATPLSGDGDFPSLEFIN